MSLLRTAEMEQPALAQQQLWPSQGSRGRILQHSILLGLPAVESLEKERSHLHSRQKEQEVTGSSCRAKEGNLNVTLTRAVGGDSHWKSGNLWISAWSCRSVVKYYTSKRVEKATWSSCRFCNHCCILRYAPIILIWNAFSSTTSLMVF